MATPGEQHDEIRKELQSLQVKIVEFGRDMAHFGTSLSTIIQNAAKHDAKDDERFADVDKELRDLSARQARYEDFAAASKWMLKTILACVIPLLIMGIWAISKAILTQKVGGP